MGLPVSTSGPTAKPEALSPCNSPLSVVTPILRICGTCGPGCRIAFGMGMAITKISYLGAHRCLEQCSVVFGLPKSKVHSTRPPLGRDTYRNVARLLSNIAAINVDGSLKCCFQVAQFLSAHQDASEVNERSPAHPEFPAHFGLWKYSEKWGVEDSTRILNLLAIPPCGDFVHEHGLMELLPGRMVDGSGSVHRI